MATPITNTSNPGPTSGSPTTAPATTPQVGTVQGAAAADASAKKNDALWYVFSGIGRAYLVQRGTAASTDADVSSVHGYNTIEQALKNANTNNATTQATISQWNEYASLPVGGGTAGVIETVNVTWKNGTPDVSTKQDPTTAAAKQDIPGASDVSSIVGFLSTLGEANTWIRIAKVVGGAIILFIGLAHLTGADKAIGGAVGKAVKAAPLLAL